MINGSIQQKNRKRILDYLRGVPAVSIAEVSASVGVSKPTVKKVMDSLIDKGLVCRAGKGESTDEGGKKPALFRFNRNSGCIFALHIGPDFIYAAITDLHSEIIHSVFRTLEQLPAAEIVAIAADIITDFKNHRIIQDSSLVTVVIGLPGIVDSGCGVSVFSPHFAEWGNDFKFRDELLARVDLDVPVYFDCVNRYQAFGEKACGRAVDKNNFLIIDALREGVGGGVMVNGQLKHGEHNLSGEIGHMIIAPDSDALCICGGRGCFEAMVSAERVEGLIRKGYEENRDSAVFAGKAPEEITIDDLFNAAGRDRFADELLSGLSYWFALGLNNVIMVNDPELIIIQGIYTKAGDKFLADTKQMIDEMSLFTLKRNVEIEYSGFGDERGVVGAAAFGVWKYFQDGGLYR